MPNLGDAHFRQSDVPDFALRLQILQSAKLVFGRNFRVDSMPYGGTRDSGLGREGVRFAIEEMTERKLLVVRQA